MQNKVEWMDIVRINDEYYLERFDVGFEDSRLSRYKFGNDMLSIEKKLEKIEENLDDFDADCLFDCSDFFYALQEKYGLTDDELDNVETYLFDDINLPEEVTKEFDIAWLGGYINGVNI